MKVRITFRSEICIEGKDLDEIKENWIETPLFSKEALKNGSEFIEVCSSERIDDGSYKEIDLD